MQARCAWLSFIQRPSPVTEQLRSRWLPHVVLGTVASTCFALEDIPAVYSAFPLIHSLWHVLSAASMGATVPVLVLLEQEQELEVLSALAH